jgi:hypothetical protein
MIKKAIYLIFASLISIGSWAQQLSECETLFRKATEKVKELRSGGTNGFQMTGRIVVTTFDGAVYHQSLEIKFAHKKYQYLTDHLSLYQDEHSLVVVQRDQQSIFVTKPPTKKMQSNHFNDVMALQDSLGKHLRLAACSKEFGVIEKNAGYIKMTFDGNDAIRTAGLHAITYWVDTETLAVRKILIQYLSNSGSGIKTYEMIVDQMDLHYDRIPFAGEAIARILQDNKLKGEYQSYQLIDKRF